MPHLPKKSVLKHPLMGALAAALLPAMLGVFMLASSLEFYRLVGLVFVTGGPLVAFLSLGTVSQQRLTDYRDIACVSITTASFVQFGFAVIFCAGPGLIQQPVILFYMVAIQFIIGVVVTIPLSLLCAAIFWCIAVRAEEDIL